MCQPSVCFFNYVYVCTYNVYFSIYLKEFSLDNFVLLFECYVFKISVTVMENFISVIRNSKT